MHQLSREPEAVHEPMKDMDRMSAQFCREDGVTQACVFEYARTVTIASDLMTQLEQRLMMYSLEQGLH